MTPNRQTVIINLPPEFDRLRAAYDPATMAGALSRAIARGMDRANLIVLGTIQRERFNGVGPFPVSQQRLGHRSRRLVRSLNASRAVVRNASRLSVGSGIGSNVKYFGAHEFGLSAPVEVPAHDRKLASGRTVKVRAHYRMMRMPERRPLRAGLTETKNQEAYLANLWDEMEPVLLGKGGRA